MKKQDLMTAWGKILTGSVPLLSIEITRECPLSCPGCYAYGESHLGGGINLRQLSDYRGDDLVNGILDLVRRHRPVQVSLVGGEPLVRHRELSKALPLISDLGVWSMVVTSAVIPIPMEWMDIPRTVVAVSIDGLRPEHDVRRKPATYEKILKNIAGRRVNVHLTVTRPMLDRDGYLEEYFAFWSAQPEVTHMWMSTYSPQIGENSPEMLLPESREKFIELLPKLKQRFPKLLMSNSTGHALTHPPANPSECTFARMSVNYSADLESRVEPCIFGGTPDCSQCGCAISVALHAIQPAKVIGPVRLGHLVRASTRVGNWVNRCRRKKPRLERWKASAATDAA